MEDEVTKLKEELIRKEKKIAEQERLLGEYWEIIQSLRFSNRLKSIFGVFKWQSFVNKFGINGSNISFLRSEKPVIFIKIAAPNWLVAPYWGDYHFAKSLRKNLVQLGYRVEVHVVQEWYSLKNEEAINLVLRGPKKVEKLEGKLNIMWNISHPKDISIEEYDTYDHVFVASDFHYQNLKKDLGSKVSVLLQCTDPDLFYPCKNSNISSVVFIGNSHGAVRPIVRSAIEAKIDVDIYGKDWSGLVDESLIKGEFIENRKLLQYYSNSAAILSDHWQDMRDFGFLSNRVYDVLACDGSLITDKVIDMPIEIKSRVYCWDGTSNHLKTLIDICGLEGTKNKMSVKFNEKEHSYRNRAMQIDKWIKNNI